MSAARAVRSRIAAGERFLLVNVDYPSPGLVERLGRCGIGLVFFDCEQGPVDLEPLENMARAARVAGMVSLVRVWTRDDWMIERLMFRGVDGIVVPRVDDAATAVGVVETVAYCFPETRDDKIVVIQIESAEAVAALDEILAVDGIDAFFVGPVDLSKSCGHGGRIDTPEMVALCDEVLARIHAAGKRSAILARPDTLERHVRNGVGLLYCHVNDFLDAGARRFRDGLEPGP